MFTIARYIVRNKIGVVLVLGMAAVFLAPVGEEAEEVSNSPWARSRSAEQSGTQEGGFVDDMMAEASDLIESSGLDPRDETTARLESAAAGFGSAKTK